MSDAGQRYWDRNAPRYERSMILLGGPLAPTLARVAAAVRGAEEVLEVAAGTGLFTAAIAPVVGRLLATVYAPAMVAELERAGFEVTEAEVMPGLVPIAFVGGRKR